MKVKESDARGLMKALNAPKAAKSPLKQLTTKLNELPRWAGQVEEPEDADLKRLFHGLCEAVQEGDAITVDADGDASDGNGRAEADAPAAKPAKGGKAAKPAKAAKAAKGPDAPAAKPAKAAKADKPTGKPMSAKEKVHRLWSKSKDKTTARAQEYSDATQGGAKVSTVRGWISAWARGQNLPAYVRAKE